MKSLSTALFLVAVLSRTVFAQDACSVDINDAQGALRLASNECYEAYSCQPDPVGCWYWKDMVEPTVAAIAPPHSYIVSLRTMDAVRIRTSLPEFAIVQEWRGTMGWYVDSWVMDVSDSTFQSDFE